MRRFRLFFKRILVMIFEVLLIAILSYADENVPEEKEQVLGFFKLGETLDKVEEKLGEIGEIYEGAIYGECSSGRLYFLIEKDNKVLKGISYADMNIQDDYNYPKTSQGITIGSRLGEVEQAYGIPKRKISGRSWFVLKDSELSMVYLYKGLWIMFVNQKPYSDIGDWRVVDIAIGDVKESRVMAAPAYATWSITQDKKDNIIRSYEKKYGKQKDLEIYDNYTLNREIGYFKYLKSKGEYLVTFLMILPKERGSKLLPVIFNYNSRFWQNTQRLAKKQTSAKYGISSELMERITKKVEHFKTADAYEEIVELE